MKIMCDIIFSDQQTLGFYDLFPYLIKIMYSVLVQTKVQCFVHIHHTRKINFRYFNHILSLFLLPYPKPYNLNTFLISHIQE